MKIDFTLEENVLKYEDMVLRCYIMGYKHLLQNLDDNSGNKHIIDNCKIKILSGDIFVPVLNKAFVKESNIHGLGVFAKCDIEKGELVTFYPGDIVQYDTLVGPKEGNYVLHHPSERFASMYGTSVDTLIIHSKNSNYLLTIDEKYRIIGEPTLLDDPCYLGHMINDATKCTDEEKYLKSNYLNTNCSFYISKGDLRVMVVATKNIRKDEELLVSYGVDYWKSYNK